MSNPQIAWLLLGMIFGLLMLMPFKRCLSTHTGIVSMLIGSLLGLFTVPLASLAVVVGLTCFSYGLYQNHHKYTGVINHDSQAK